MFVGSMVESSCGGTSCHAYSSYWSNKKGDDQAVYHEGPFSYLINFNVLFLYNELGRVALTKFWNFRGHHHPWMWRHSPFWLVLYYLDVHGWQGTVEEKMEAVQARKQRLILGALTDQEVRTARIEELKMLFTWKHWRKLLTVHLCHFFGWVWALRDPDMEMFKPRKMRRDASSELQDFEGGWLRLICN